jgi:hypothetical protein
MITTAAGPQGVFHAGTTVDVPEGLARAWVAGHAAVLVGGVLVETAMLAPAQPITAPVETRATEAEVGDPVITWGQCKDMTVSQAYAKDPDYVKKYLTVTEKDTAVAAAAKAIAG